MVKIISFIARFLSMFIKTYIPQRVYVSKSALSYPRTQHIIRRIKNLIARLWLSTSLPTHHRAQILQVRPFTNTSRRRLLFVNALLHIWKYLHHREGFQRILVWWAKYFHCPLRCLFCYLDVSGRGTPWTRIYVDVENFYSQAVAERLVYKMTLTLWSAVSFT